MGSTEATTGLALERRRTGWDVVFGLFGVVAGAIVLGHVAIASVVSVLFVGWLALIGGLVVAIGAIIGWRHGAHRSDLLAGALMAILGFAFVRNPGIALLALTVVAGSLLILGGIIRLAAAFEPDAPRAVLIFNGLLTLALGLLVMLRWPVSALWLLGTVLGVQLVMDGLTTALVGRYRLVDRPAAPEPA